jgi:hypothetical protein
MASVSELPDTLAFLFAHQYSGRKPGDGGAYPHLDAGQTASLFEVP